MIKGVDREPSQKRKSPSKGSREGSPGGGHGKPPKGEKGKKRLKL